MPRHPVPQLICPAGSLPALKAAVDHGADAVYLGYRNDTNARNFAGLNFVQGVRMSTRWPFASAAFARATSAAS